MGANHGDHRGAILRNGEVELDGVDPPPFIAQLLHEGKCSFGSGPVGKGHRSTLSGELPDDRAADTSGAPGDEGGSGSIAEAIGSGHPSAPLAIAASIWASSHPSKCASTSRLCWPTVGAISGTGRVSPTNLSGAGI